MLIGNPMVKELLLGECIPCIPEIMTLPRLPGCWGQGQR